MNWKPLGGIVLLGLIAAPFVVVLARNRAVSEAAWSGRSVQHEEPMAGAERGIEARADGYLGMSLPTGFRAFSADSPWNTPIPEDAEIDLGSEIMIYYLKTQVKDLRGNFVEWSSPIHVADTRRCRRVNVRTIHEALSPVVDPDDNGIAENVPVPVGAWPDPEQDGMMVVVDPIARKAWEYSVFKEYPGGWVEGGNVYVWDLDGPGYRPPFDGERWWTTGVTAAGLPLIGGLVRPEEIEEGEIRHALMFAGATNRKSAYPGGKREVCVPASRTDAIGIGFMYIPMGARLQLNPSLDLDELGLSEPTKIVARALQKYGMLNVMSTASHLPIFFQNVGPDGGAWAQYDFFRDLRKIPVEEFRVLKCEIVVHRK